MGGGLGGPDPLENHKRLHIGFLRNSGVDIFYSHHYISEGRTELLDLLEGVSVVPEFRRKPICSLL